ncbi:MAG: glycosyltransferase family 2 protein [Bacteroidales bacterium]|nr:glycosyltransferase family 2 protein [Bacteroidales bacterium]
MIIDILLSTYNSEAYIEELLESLYSQSYKNWRLIIRDDGSSDSTLVILNKQKKINPEKFQLIENNKIQLGPKKSYEKLLEQSTADYIMFCDHDDYWLSHKIEDSLNKIKELENNDPNKAALVFTDLIITDQDLKPINKSFWKYSKINPDNIHSVYKLAINNPVVGCTVMINKKAKSLILPIPDEAIMHDWWAALKVAEAGIIGYIEQPSILYRQHDLNKIGADKVGFLYFLKRVFGFSKTIKQNRDAYKMLKALDKKYSGLKMMYYKIGILFSKNKISL